MDSHIQTINEPVFVSEEEARRFREDHEAEAFVSGGWYVEAEVQCVDTEVEGHKVGSVVVRYWGPYDTEEAALAAIPKIAPGVFVQLE